MPHIVEIWDMEGDGGTVWTPACLSCGWVGTGGPRPAAETEAALHEAGESASIVIAGKPAAGPRRSSGPRGRRPTD